MGFLARIAVRPLAAKEVRHPGLHALVFDGRQELLCELQLEAVFVAHCAEQVETRRFEMLAHQIVQRAGRSSYIVCQLFQKCGILRLAEIGDRDQTV